MAERHKVNTPMGTARWPRLATPDTKYAEHGEYKCDLIVPLKEAEPFIAKVEKLYAAEFKEQKLKKKADFPWEEELDDQDNKTGNVVLKCKVKNRLTKSGEVWDRKPPVFDSKGNRVEANIGGGSKLRMNLELYFWGADSLGFGVSLQINAVQIIELVEYDAASADSFGFDEVEDGYVTKDDDEEEDCFEEGKDDTEKDDTEVPEGEEDDDLF
jgi:hypothetical protein